MLASLLVAALAAAPAPPGPPPARAGLTLERFQATRAGQLMSADLDGDGRLSPAEFAAAHPRLPDPARLFARFDADHDGYLSRAEIDAMLARRFARMDADGDGVVSAAERAAARPMRRGPAAADRRTG